MNKSFFYLLILFTGLFVTTENCFSKDVAGFIVTNENDTIFGTVQVSKFDQLNGALMLFGYESNSFYSSVVFKSKDQKRFKNYFPENISGFSYSDKDGNFFFKSFKIKHNSIFENEKERYQFLCLVYKGSYELYKDLYFVENTYVNKRYEKYQTFTDYYLYSPDKGLFKVDNYHYKNIIDLLKAVQVDKRFIELVPENICFENIKSLLKIYDSWIFFNNN